MGPAVEISGGSAANTIVGVASFGGRAAFVGKVKNDDLGEVFAHDIRTAGVAFDTPPAADGPSTARCYVLVTPDGERTMNTFLGAAQNLTPDDVNADAVASAAITYLEGYLWDPPQAKEAFRKAATIAHGAGRQVALTLSDAFCVGRYRAEFVDLIRGGTVDIVFANEAELEQPLRVLRLRHSGERSARGCEIGRRHAQREGLRRGQQGQLGGCARHADRQDGRCDRRGRFVRGGLPVRAGARARPSHRGPARGHGGGGGDPASRGAAGDVTEGIGAEERPPGVTVS